MSLTFQNEHLAWQQRLRQEVTRQSQFYQGYDRKRSSFSCSSDPKTVINNYFDQNTNLTPRANSSFTSSFYARIKQNPLLKKQFRKSFYKNSNFNLSYSFGGTRPIKEALKDQSDKSSYISSRPHSIITHSTARSSYIGLNAKESMFIGKTPPKEIVKITKKGIPSYRKSLEPQLQEELPIMQEELIKSIPQLAEENQQEIEESSNEEQQDEVPLEILQLEKELQEKRPETTYSSSSQKYIEELEKMLIEERRRRVIAEKQIN